MGLRSLPFFKAKKGWQFAGGGLPSDSSGGGGGSGINYSTEEQLTSATWVDGKPIYYKTVALNISGGMQDTAHGISNLGYVVDIRGACHVSFGSGKSGFFPYAYPETQGGWLSCSVSDTYITITSAGQSGVAPMGTSYVTIYYTKTTD